MADHSGNEPAPCVGELRRLIERRLRRRRRLALGLLAAAALMPLAISILWKPPILLVWNASASAPVGLYLVSPGEPLRRGDIAIARTPAAVRAMAARRHYLPANVPLVKRVAAVAGDRVCASGGAISINGRRIAVRRGRDAAGRPLPWWTGCRPLHAQEYFLLMDSPLSFDGRYFGLSRRSDILGRAELLWRRPADSTLE